MHFTTLLFLLGLAAEGSSGSPPVPKLDWVNPARCFSSCDFRPETLVRANASAVVSQHGQHELTAETLTALRRLFQAASAAGHTLRIKSPFRSYRGQASVFNKFGQEPGRAARPGHSEHQNGTAADLSFSSVAAQAWLAHNAHLYGFTLSYPVGKERVTGYRAEAWHIRFVGLKIAAELHERGLTLEELFRERPELGRSGDCHDCPLPVSRAACGRATSEGNCHGAVLTWCYDGALATVDCSASGASCGHRPGRENASCVGK